jgi:DNA-binding transcriptional ArsR family regulator
MTATLDDLVDTLKAAAETSRLRILALLSRGDLTVSDLTEILNQSQPRVSRHLKLLLEAGLIGRYQERGRPSTFQRTPRAGTRYVRCTHPIARSRRRS